MRGSEVMKEKLRLNRLGRLLTYTKSWMFLYWIGLLGIAGQSFASNYISAFGFKGLADASISRNMDAMVNSLLYISVGFGIMIVIIPCCSFAFESTIKKITGLIRKDLFDHIQRLPLKYIENQHSGDLISRLTNDVQTAENAYGWQLVMILMALISGIGSTIMIFHLSWKLAIIAVLLGGANVLINTLFVKPLQRISDEAQKALSSSTQKLTDMLAGSQVIRIFNLVHKMAEQYRKENIGIRVWSMKRVVLNSYLNSITNFVSFMSFVGMIMIGGIMVANKEITFGVLIAVVQFMNGIVFMFRSVGSFITQLQGSLAGAERIFEILDLPTENPEIFIGGTETVVQEYRNQLDVQREKNPAIVFQDVNFSYEPETTILHEFNSSVYKDQVIAVVGLSGSGKSTLFKLLLRFYAPDSGNIQIFGKHLSAYRLEELRKMISYVPQDNYLFSGTIEENIGYGLPDSSQEKIIDAARAAYAHDFIMEMPDGYQTQVGERGTHLSGGQRQRIAIARALLKNAPILLLDEATSSLDSESEQQVQQALEVLMKGRTTMVVAHRLSTIQHADRILVLDSGKIVEEGNHEALLHLDNRYARLYNLQFKDIVPQVNPI